MRFSFLLLARISLPVLACPDIAGIYKTCHSSPDQNATIQVTVEQKIVNKFYQYTFTSQEAEGKNIRVEKYIADGKMRVVSDTDADTGITLKTETITTCLDNSLNIKMDATVDSEAFANVTIKASKDGNRLTQVFSGVSMGDPVNDTIICE